LIQGRRAIREAYGDDDVVRTYTDQRFLQPLGALLHRRQVTVVRAVIKAEQPMFVLEIAPGPARVTSDIAAAYAGTGVLVDASAPMLAEARRRLRGAVGWRFLQGDAFMLPLRRPFDLAYSFRLIRHFPAEERRALLRQIRDLLKPGGLLLFDAVNAAVSAPLRAGAAPEELRHYDALLSVADIEADIGAAGLELVRLHDVQRHYTLLRWLQIYVAPRCRSLARGLMEVIDRIPGAPLEWIVVCRRR
jgi:ubiquinone/menaquinone biosynthesis C-methylase UbiE